MSHGKKSKRPKHQANTKPVQPSGEKNPRHHCDVRAFAEISRSPSLRDEVAAERKQDSAHQDRAYKIEKWALGLSGAAALFTFLIFLANKGAVDAARETLQELHSQQRPWIVVKDAQIIKLEPNSQAMVDVIFTNAGHMPAFDTNLVASLYVGNDATADVPPLGQADDITPAILAPTMDMRISLHTTEPTLPNQIELLKNPATRYYVYGMGTYTDGVAGIEPARTRHLQFCVYATYGKTGVTPCVNKRYKNTAD